MNMFRLSVVEDEFGRFLLALALGGVHLGIVGGAVWLLFGETGLFFCLLVSPLLSYVALSTALMMIASPVPERE
jgi:hypothetical protein